MPVSPLVALIQGASWTAMTRDTKRAAIKMFGAHFEKLYAPSVIVAIRRLRVATASESLMMIPGSEQV
jgi:hypothetical protein